MPETLTAPRREQLSTREKLIYQQAAREIAALVLMVLMNEKSRHLIAEAHTPQKTDQTNRERWQNLLHNFGHIPRTEPHNRTTRTYQEAEADFDFHASWHGNTQTETPRPQAEAFTQPEATQPQPPTMPFEFFPSSMKPSETETAGAARANELMRQGLTEQGWEGGVPSQDQLKKATRSTLSNLHPDRNPDLSPTDVEAGKLISGQMSEIKIGLYGNGENPQPSAAPSEHQPSNE